VAYVSSWRCGQTLAQEPSAPVEPPRSQLVESIKGVATEVRRLREAQEQSAAQGPSELDRDDLKAQQEMARWAFWALFVNALGLLFVGWNLAKTSQAVALNSKQLLFDNRPWIEITRIQSGGHLFIF
jgi:hypothetical protein